MSIRKRAHSRVFSKQTNTTKIHRIKNNRKLDRLLVHSLTRCPPVFFGLNQKKKTPEEGVVEGRPEGHSMH